MGFFGSKYAKSRPTKDHDNDNKNRNKFNRHQDNNAIVKQSVDGILHQENNKVSAEEEVHKNTKSDFDENNLYQVDNMSLDDKK